MNENTYLVIALVSGGTLLVYIICICRFKIDVEVETNAQVSSVNLVRLSPNKNEL